MKVLRLNTYMLLPDSFDGTFEDAVNLWLKLYHSTEPLPEKTNASIRVAHEALFLNSQSGFTVVAEAGVHELYKRAWTRRDKNPEVCYSQADAWIK